MATLLRCIIWNDNFVIVDTEAKQAPKEESQDINWEDLPANNDPVETVADAVDKIVLPEDDSDWDPAPVEVAKPSTSEQTPATSKQVPHAEVWDQAKTITSEAVAKPKNYRLQLININGDVSTLQFSEKREVERYMTKNDSLIINAVMWNVRKPDDRVVLKGVNNGGSTNTPTTPEKPSQDEIKAILEETSAHEEPKTKELPQWKLLLIEKLEIIAHEIHDVASLLKVGGQK